MMSSSASTAFVTILLHLLLLESTSGSVQYTISSLPPHQGGLMEGKTRLGSTPPSCHNRCSECRPCMAVQVPTQPSRDRVRAGFSTDHMGHDRGVSSEKYSNYKPLDWKCRCGSRLFNP